MIRNERQAALDGLIRIFQKKETLMEVTPHLSSYSKMLVFGVCRYFYALDAILSLFITKKISQHVLHTILLLGFYEQHYLKHPAYAVVKSMVDLVPKHQAWAKKLINAILRNYERHFTEKSSELIGNPAFEWNHPAWFQTILMKHYPNHWQTILTENDRHPPLTLRINTLQTTRTSYRLKLDQAGLASTPHPHVPTAVTLHEPCPVQNLPEFTSGACFVQDAAAQCVGLCFNLKPHDRFLDACAAPGGKTTLLLEQEPTLSMIALDIDKTRLMRIQDNLTRLSLHAKLIQGNALTPETWWDGALFDHILIDAPCSATGVIRRHPDLKLQRKPEHIQTITRIQAQLLETLWPLLKIGGRLVYATCSILPEENEQQIQNFLSKTPQATLQTLPYFNTLSLSYTTPYGYQILPGESHMDGFFYSVLQKTEAI